MKPIDRNQPAFPAQAAQDNLGRVFTPFPGFTRYEYVLLQFALSGVAELAPEDDLTDKQISKAIMQGAKMLAEAYFEAIDDTPETKVINL